MEPDIRLCLQTDTKKISAVSIFFETMPYRLNEETGFINYDEVFPFRIAALHAYDLSFLNLLNIERKVNCDAVWFT